MLALVVVLFVAVGVSDGLILTKCELKQQLERGLTLQIPNSADVLAQIVCHVNKTSGFNTNTIKTIPEPKFPGGGRHVRSPGRNGQGAASQQSSSSESNENQDEVWTLYGLFQLSDQVVCASTQSGALNLCNMPCDKLLDDDTSDDIACVQTLINAITSDPNAARHIIEMVSLLRQQDCRSQTAAAYFSNC